MWIVIFGAVFIAAIACFWYLCSRVYLFVPEIKNVGGTNVRWRVFASCTAVICFFTMFSLMLGYMNAIIIVVHLALFWLLSDLLFFIIKKIRKKGFKYNFAAALAVVATFVYLTVGFVLANNVYVTRYDMYTDKYVGELRIILFADSHVGATFDGEGLAEYCKRMNEYDPDIVVISGDFVDDETTRENMIAACKSLGTLTPEYGVFYVFGNHDKGYYDNALRGFTVSDLVDNLTGNGVTVLEDEAVLINDRFYVIGRADASEKDRAEISALTADLDKTKYAVVLNHQPTDYKNESVSSVDLVLGGHTHGGQMAPIGLISDLFGLNDRTYGSEKRGNTNFVVTSGISDWEIKFKTGCFSEFVVVDVHGKKN